MIPTIWASTGEVWHVTCRGAGSPSGRYGVFRAYRFDRDQRDSRRNQQVVWVWWGSCDEKRVHHTIKYCLVGWKTCCTQWYADVSRLLWLVDLQIWWLNLTCHFEIYRTSEFTDHFSLSTLTLASSFMREHYRASKRVCACVFVCFPGVCFYVRFSISACLILAEAQQLSFFNVQFRSLKRNQKNSFAQNLLQ